MFAKVVLLAGVLALSGGAAIAGQSPQDRANPNPAVGTSQSSRSSPGQDGDPQLDLGQRLEDIVVDGSPIEDLARQFVEEAARPVAGRGLARWMRPVCIGAVNFRREVGEAIADGVAARASEFGIAIEDAPCTPSLLIVGAADGAEFADAWVRRRPRDFRWNVTGSRDRASSLERLKTSADPVRWWHISIPTYYDVFYNSVAPAVRVPGRAAPSRMVYAMSQLRGRTRDDMVRSVVVVDVNAVAGLSTQQLSDYLTMVSFAQIDPAADVSSFDSILNLFRAPDANPRMTAWDEAYMRSLYSADDTYRLNAVQQAEGLAETFEASLKRAGKDD